MNSEYLLRWLGVDAPWVGEYVCPGWALCLLAVPVLVYVVELVSGLLRKKVVLRGKHVLVTGGSQGIGLSLCERLARDEGVAAISIVARNKAKLNKAAKAIKTLNGDVKVSVHSCDTTDAEGLVAAVEAAEKEHGPVQVLFSVAGMSIPGYIMDQDASVFQKQVNVNYMGTVNAVKAVLPGMAARREGAICLVSSGICAGTFVGYASYSPTKFAVRAFADTLRNEVLGFNIHVCVSFPPDTLTPGFETEEKTKPAETTAITPPATHASEDVAGDLVQRFKNGKYHLHSLEMDATLSIMMTSGIAPRGNVLFEALVAPVLTVVQHCWRIFHADPIARRYGQRVAKEEKQD
jgi:NAD(P)-dependent dehydrogenase (short-subunit alcohol dehydrogenase family)